MYGGIIGDYDEDEESEEDDASMDSYDGKGSAISKEDEANEENKEENMHGSENEGDGDKESEEDDASMGYDEESFAISKEDETNEENKEEDIHNTVNAGDQNPDIHIPNEIIGEADADSEELKSLEKEMALVIQNLRKLSKSDKDKKLLKKIKKMLKSAQNPKLRQGTLDAFFGTKKARNLGTCDEWLDYTENEAELKKWMKSHASFENNKHRKNDTFCEECPGYSINPKKNLLDAILIGKTVPPKIRSVLTLKN